MLNFFEIGYSFESNAFTSQNLLRMVKGDTQVSIAGRWKSPSHSRPPKVLHTTLTILVFWVFKSLLSIQVISWER